MEKRSVENTRVFVTGGSGVIGMELVPRLVDLGADVLVGDLKYMPQEFTGKVRYRQGDLNSMTKAELLAFDPEIIIHLAATFERSIETLEFWDENFQHNLRLSHHLMSIAQYCDSLKRVVFASSYLVYDEALYQFDAPQASPIKLNEGDAIRPRNLIGMAKLSHEMELQFLAGFSKFRFSTLCVRIFRGYGCRSRDVISRWVRSLLRGESITVYRPEGFFDYIYAGDSAEGLMRLAFCNEAVGIVNLGTGRSHRVLDVVDILKKYFPDASILYEDSSIPFEASEASTAKLESLIGWKPQRLLDEAISTIIDFEKVSLSLGARENKKQRLINSVLLTSASRKIPLIRALEDATKRISQDMKVVAGDIDPLAISRFEADAFWVMPQLDDSMVNKLIDECRARSITIVLPTRDGELEFWSRHRDQFTEAGIEVIISNPDAILRCMDKLEFSSFGIAAGLPIIPSATSPNPFIGSTLVVKERFGSGSRGLGLNLTNEQAIEHARQLAHPIFQPFVSGDEISIDAWVRKDGKVIGVVLRKRDRVICGESQVTTTFRDKALENQALQIISTLELRGPVVMQAIVANGLLQVIECNPRFGGASTASIAVGLDSLYWSLAEAIDSKFQPNFQRTSQNIRQVRIPRDLLIHDSNF